MNGTSEPVGPRHRRARSVGASRRRLRARAKLWPGEPGTQRLLRIHGDALVCVRYLVDEERATRLTTVELVVDEAPLIPRPSRIVGLRVGIEETVVQRLVRGAGGVWDRERRLWRLPRGKAAALSLEDRIVPLPPKPRGDRWKGISTRGEK